MAISCRKAQKLNYLSSIIINHPYWIHNMSIAPLHDLVIRTVAEYLCGFNETLVNLQRVNTRFYSLCDIFIGRIWLSQSQSDYAIMNKPYGWNKVYSMLINGYHYRNYRYVDWHALGSIHSLYIAECYIPDLSILRRVHTLIFRNCGNIHDVSSLSSVKRLTFIGCFEITGTEALKSVPKLSINGRKN